MEIGELILLLEAKLKSKNDYRRELEMRQEQIKQEIYAETIQLERLVREFYPIVSEVEKGK